MNTKPLTNEVIAELLRPIDAVLAPDLRQVEEEAQAEVDRAIEVFVRSTNLSPIDELSLPAKAALRHRIFMASTIATIAPHQVMLDIPRHANEAQMRVFSIVALHRRPDDLLDFLDPDAS
jgi:hypothetical protein